MYTIGADPELFLQRGKDFVSAIGKIGGSKYDPRYLLGGFALQEDNVAVEYNIPVCKNADRFVWANQLMLEEIKKIADSQGLSPALVSSANFSQEELSHPLAQVFGCDPDFNAWELEINPAPHCSDSSLRSAGGHIHIGLPEDTQNTDKVNIIKVCDLLIGVPLAFMDPESKRRSLYGKAGACRFKTYGVEYRTPSNVWLRSPEITNAVGMIVIALEECWKDYLSYTNENETLIKRAINELDEKAYYTLKETFGQFWPSKILKEFVKVSKKDSYITLTIEE